MRYAPTLAVPLFLVTAAASVGGGEARGAGPRLEGLAARPSCGAPVLEVHPVRILVEAPAEAIVGEGCRFTFLMGDTWGPEGPAVPTAGLAEGMRFDIRTSDGAADLPERLHLSETDGGRGRGEVVFHTPGLHRIFVIGEPGLVGESAPLRVWAEPPQERVYWGDLHGHLHTPGFGHAGRLAPEDYARVVGEGLEFGRDVSNLDFCAFTPHVQTAGGLAREQSGAGSPWAALLREVERFQEDGRFVVFPGYEWQGPQGDHCVVLPGPGPLVAPFDFLALADSVAARGALLNAHAIFLPTDFAPRVGALTGVEVTRDCQSTERLGLAAIERWLTPAFLGCSDTHGGAIGATSLTGIRAPRLTRAAVLEAIRAGRCWATNGERIVLDFAVDTTQAAPTLRLVGVATGPIDRVEFLRNARVIATIRDVSDSVEFTAEHEDCDVFRFEWLDDVVIYHARVVQTTANHYDPSWRDLAVTSPLKIRPRREFFDGAHAAAVAGASPPGEALMELRAAWNSFRAAPGLPLFVDDPAAAVPVWTETEIAVLRSAVQRVRRLAAEDICLGGLAQTLASAPLIAEAVVTAWELVSEIVEVEREPGRPSPGTLARLEAGARVFHDQVARARAAGREDGWTRLQAVWFGVSLLDRLGRQVLEGLAELREREARPRAVVFGNPDQEITRLEVPIDPRVLEEVLSETPRWRELRGQMAERWGYTSGPRESLSEAAQESAVLQVRVIAEGSPVGAVLVVGAREDPRRVPLVRGTRGWVAALVGADLPLPGGPRPVLEFASPVRVEGVFVEGPLGRPLRDLGRLEELKVHRKEGVVRPAPVIVGDSLDVRVELESAGGSRVLLDAVFPAGETALAFPLSVDERNGAFVARWGFAGWRRMGGTEVPGGEVVRPSGFGALPDGRAVLAYQEYLLLVDPVGGAREMVTYPRGRKHERGRELCIAPLADETVLVRGACGPLGGWVARLDPATMAWSDVPPGPEAGTVAPLPGGGYAWLVGRQIHRRVAAADLPPLPSDVTGRLLGFDCGGRPLVRVQPGETVRLDPSSGAVVERISALVLAVDTAGALVVLDGTDRRHPELALAIHLRRSLPDASTGPAHRLAFRPSPVLDPPVLAAGLPDGALLLLGGTTWWRREPAHDWWGVSVERWEPVWAGVTRVEQ